MRNTRSGLTRNGFLEEIQRYVCQRNTQAGKETLSQEATGVLFWGQAIRDKRTVRFHRSIVTRIQQPQQQNSHPQSSTKRINEQTQTTTDRTDEEERLTTTPAWTPGTVTHRADQRLDDQPRHQPDSTAVIHLDWHLRMKKSD